NKTEQRHSFESILQQKREVLYGLGITILLP
ncbi:MAG: hypothetical protein ACI808_000566, partial [Paraglaciecola sp.]